MITDMKHWEYRQNRPVRLGKFLVMQIKKDSLIYVWHKVATELNVDKWMNTMIKGSLICVCILAP
jgi:hypothetical protein